MQYDGTDISTRYDAARRLSGDTMTLWIDSITRRIPPGDIYWILDVGCGTGRFSGPLAEAFAAELIGLDTSQSMLAHAQRNCVQERVHFCRGDAVSLPVQDASACLAFLSMAFHHIQTPQAAAREFMRVLRPGGFVCIRNSTSDLLEEFLYLRYFPQAIELNRRRLPSQAGLAAALESNGLALSSHDVVWQEFARTAWEFVDKISQRGLSDLVSLPDAEFEEGLRRMRTSAEAGDMPETILDPVDLFVFQKKA